MLIRGLSDNTVRTGRRLALYERARKICEAPKSKYADKINNFEHLKVLPTPEVCLKYFINLLLIHFLYHIGEFNPYHAGTESD